jgi:hypothetical protein
MGGCDEGTVFSVGGDHQDRHGIQNRELCPGNNISACACYDASNIVIDPDRPCVVNRCNIGWWLDSTVNLCHLCPGMTRTVCTANNAEAARHVSHCFMEPTDRLCDTEGIRDAGGDVICHTLWEILNLPGFPGPHNRCYFNPE